MLSKLLASVSSNYSPELAEALRVGLAVVCSTSRSKLTLELSMRRRWFSEFEQ